MNLIFKTTMDALSEGMKNAKRIIYCQVLLFMFSGLPAIILAQEGAESSAIFELSSTEQGILIPRMTSAQRNGILNPANGLMVYDIDQTSFWFFDSVKWHEIAVGSVAVVLDEDEDTKIQVESLPDEDQIHFDVGGSEVMVIDDSGRLGLGTSNPDTNLHVVGNIKMVDGLQKAGRVMYSDSNGVASWQDPAIPMIVEDSDNDTKIMVDQGNDEDQIRFDVMGSQAMILTEFGQLGIGAEDPHASAVLQVQSGAKGVILAKMTHAMRQSIDNPAVGLIIYQTDVDRGFYEYNGADWVRIGSNISDGKLAIASIEYRDAGNNRGLDGYNQLDNSPWQSFTAERTGSLTRLDLFLTGPPPSESPTISVYKGEGTTGNLLESKTYYQTSVNGLNTFSIEGVEVIEGKKYTIRVSDDSGKWKITDENTYTGGRSDLSASKDYGFQTFISSHGFSLLDADPETGDIIIGEESSSTQIKGISSLGAVDPGIQSFFQEASDEKDKGFLTTPWMYSNAIEARSERNENSTLITIGQDGNIGAGNEIHLVTNGKDRMAIKSSGKIGLGTITPKNKLDIEGGLAVGASYSGTDTAPNDGAIIEGNVGIGTNNPTRAKVEILGSQVTSLDYGWLNVDGITGTASGEGSYSLYASNRIAAVEFNAHSDARIKRIIEQSDQQNDLQTLLDIQIVDYHLKDTLQYGNGLVKKVIAQQVAKVYPEAVSANLTEVVPDIYSRAKFADGWIKLPTDLLVGDRVKIITRNGESVCNVLEVERGQFKVDLHLENNQQGEVFIYGREVDDFHTVDYEAIAMLNVSATQAQQKRIEELEEKVENLQFEKRRLEQLIVKVEKISTRLNAIDVSQ